MRYPKPNQNSGRPETLSPPWFAMRLARLLCHPDFIEEIEGDLSERFEDDVKRFGPGTARLKFWRHVLSLFKVNIMFNQNNNAMTSIDWLWFIVVSTVVVAAAFVPFLPGPYSAYFVGISGLAQMIGFFGLVMVPIGIIWLLIELRSARSKEQLTSWTSGYILSWIAFVIGFAFLILLLAVVISDLGWLFNIPSLIFVGSLFVIFIRKIRRLKTKTQFEFNPSPVYLVSLPIMALCVRLFFVEQVADYSRETAIANSQPIIAALEKYRSEHSTYPGSLADLKGQYLVDIPSSRIMGINSYDYENLGDSYELSFVQWLHWGATEERVIYTGTAQQNYKGHFASFDTSHPGWRYYWRD